MEHCDGYELAALVHTWHLDIRKALGSYHLVPAEGARHGSQQF